MKLSRANWALALTCAVLVGGLGLLAGTAAASSNEAGTSPTGTGGSAMSPSGNDECFTCHGQKPVDGTITVDGKKVPAYIDVNGEKKSIYVDRSIQANSRHGQLACISCHIGFNARHAPPSVTQGWLRTAKIRACGDCHGEEDQDVPAVLPRQSGVHQGREQSAALRRLPRRAQHRPSGHARVPPPVGGDVHQVPWRRGTTYLDSYHGKAFVPRPTRRPPSAPTATAATASCRPPTRRAPSPSRTSSRRAPGAIPAPTRTSPTSWCTSIPAARARPAGSGSSRSPTSCSSPWSSRSASVHSALYIYRGIKDGLYSRRHYRRAATRTGRAHAHRVPALQRLPPLDALPGLRELHRARVHRHAAQVQETRLGAVVHGPLRGRHRGRRVPPHRGHRHRLLLDGRDDLHDRHGAPQPRQGHHAAPAP